MWYWSAERLVCRDTPTPRPPKHDSQQYKPTSRRSRSQPNSSHDIKTLHADKVVKTCKTVLAQLFYSTASDANLGLALGAKRSEAPGRGLKTLRNGLVWEKARQQSETVWERFENDQKRSGRASKRSEMVQRPFLGGAFENVQKRSGRLEEALQRWEKP